MQSELKEIVIVGAGPAGISTAVQLKRFGLDAVILDRTGVAGGLVENANRIENYPGLEVSISGLDFAKRLRAYVDRWNLDLIKFDLKEIELVENKKILKSDEHNISAKICVLAIGTVANKYHIKEKVYYDLISLKNSQDFLDTKTISIVGGGESAFDYALSLSELGKKVVIHVRSDKLKVKGVLVERVISNKNIDVKFNSQPNKGELVLSAIGRKSLVDGIKGAEFADFIIGDARLGSLGQLGIAVGDGLSCAHKICERLNK